MTKPPRNLLESVRHGDWVGPDRIRVYSAIVLAFGLAMLVGLAASGSGLSDYQGRPLGTDFSNVYAAGKWVLAGRPEAPFDPALQHEMEKRIFGPDTPFYGWHYPPVFLGIAALLALMPYVPALFAWQGATLVLYLATMRGILRGTNSFPGRAAPSAAAGERIDLSLWLLPALAFPAVVINIAHGHNGFLSAALFGGGLLLLERRPLVAGILFGLLCYKPQLGILIPIALIAGGHWRAFVAAAVTVAAACALAWLAFGSGAWLAFRDSLEFTRTAVLEQGGTGFHKIQSVFAALRLWGAPVAVAYAAQAAMVAAAAVLLAILWRSPAAFALKATALLAGALLATPYALDYDLMVMAPAIAFFAAYGLAHGFLAYEKSALVFCWFAPLVARTIGEQTGVPVGLIALVLLFLLALRRAAAERAALPPSSARR